MTLRFSIECVGVLLLWPFIRIENKKSYGFVCDSPRNGGFRGLDYTKKVPNIDYIWNFFTVLLCTLLYDVKDKNSKYVHVVLARIVFV